MSHWVSQFKEIFNFSHSCLLDAYNFTEVCACSLDKEEDCSVFDQVEWSTFKILISARIFFAKIANLRPLFLWIMSKAIENAGFIWILLNKTVVPNSVRTVYVKIITLCSSKFFSNASRIWLPYFLIEFPRSHKAKGHSK